MQAVREARQHQAKEQEDQSGRINNHGELKGMTGKLYMLSAATSILGLLLLTFTSNQVSPPLSSIGDVSTDFLDENMRVKGRVCRLHEFDGGSMIITLCDNKDELDVYLPYDVALQVNSTSLESREIDVVGAVEVYKGRLELVVNDAGHLNPR